MANETQSNAGTTVKGAANDATNILALLLAVNQLGSSDPILKAQAATTLARLGVSATGPQLANLIGPQLASKLGPLLSAAGLGLGLANVARSDASNPRKGLESAKLAAGAVAPMFGVQQLLTGLSRKSQRSSSPQVRGLSTFAERILEPQAVGAVESVITGERSPRQAIKAGGGIGPLIGGLLNPVGTAILDSLGISPLKSEPTTGVQFRRDAGSILEKLGFGKEGKDFFSDRGIRRPGVAAGALPATRRAFDIDPDFFNQLSKESPESVALARQIGDLAAGSSPATRRRLNQDPFAIQVQNILLNNFGANLAERVRGMAGR